jgi:hypothetical protein
MTWFDIGTQEQVEITIADYLLRLLFACAIAPD